MSLPSWKSSTPPWSTTYLKSSFQPIQRARQQKWSSPALKPDSTGDIYSAIHNGIFLMSLNERRVSWQSEPAQDVVIFSYTSRICQHFLTRVPGKRSLRSAKASTGTPTCPPAPWMLDEHFTSLLGCSF